MNTLKLKESAQGYTVSRYPYDEKIYPYYKEMIITEEKMVSLIFNHLLYNELLLVLPKYLINDLFKTEEEKTE